MSRAWIVALVSLLALVVAGAGVYWARVPIATIPEHDLPTAKCGECHEGSLPLTHDEDFVAVTHGAIAERSRTSCVSCHDEQDHCEECHLARSPSWETEAVRHPERGPNERVEHAEVAAAHAASCRECHTPAWQRQCAQCHRQDEPWR